MIFLLIAGGFLCLILGGEILVSGAVKLAQRLRVPPMVIGLTLVGFGTSMPELVTSVQAALRGSPGVAVGNVVGSNIVNILLILGLAALLSPIVVNRARFRVDGAFLLGSAVLGVVLLMQPSLGLVSGLALLAGLVLFLTTAFLCPSDDPSEPDLDPHLPPVWRSGVMIALGLALTLLGARWLVSGAIDLAASLGVSESLIGLTVVAIGTSLPELVTTVIAARRGHADVALGNILGSNVFNLFGILGVTAVISPLSVPTAIQGFDLWVMLAATLAMIAVSMTGRSINRVKGTALILGYAAYTGTLICEAGLA